LGAQAGAHFLAAGAAQLLAFGPQAGAHFFAAGAQQLTFFGAQQLGLQHGGVSFEIIR